MESNKGKRISDYPSKADNIRSNQGSAPQLEESVIEAPLAQLQMGQSKQNHPGYIGPVNNKQENVYAQNNKKSDAYLYTYTQSKLDIMAQCPQVSAHKLGNKNQRLSRQGELDQILMQESCVIKLKQHESCNSILDNLNNEQKANKNRIQSLLQDNQEFYQEIHSNNFAHIPSTNTENQQLSQVIICNNFDSNVQAQADFDIQDGHDQNVAVQYRNPMIQKNNQTTNEEKLVQFHRCQILKNDSNSKTTPIHSAGPIRKQHGSYQQKMNSQGQRLKIGNKFVSTQLCSHPFYSIRGQSSEKHFKHTISTKIPCSIKLNAVSSQQLDASRQANKQRLDVRRKFVQQTFQQQRLIQQTRGVGGSALVARKSQTLMSAKLENTKKSKKESKKLLTQQVKIQNQRAEQKWQLYKNRYERQIQKIKSRKSRRPDKMNRENQYQFNEQDSIQYLCSDMPGPGTYNIGSNLCQNTNLSTNSTLTHNSKQYYHFQSNRSKNLVQNQNTKLCPPIYNTSDLRSSKKIRHSNQQIMLSHTFGTQKRFVNRRPITAYVQYMCQESDLTANLKKKYQCDNQLEHVSFGTSKSNLRSQVKKIQYCEWNRPHFYQTMDIPSVDPEHDSKKQKDPKQDYCYKSNQPRFKYPKPNYRGPDYYPRDYPNKSFGKTKSLNNFNSLPNYYFLSQVPKGIQFPINRVQNYQIVDDANKIAEKNKESQNFKNKSKKNKNRMFGNVFKRWKRSIDPKQQNQQSIQVQQIRKNSPKAQVQNQRHNQNNRSEEQGQKQQQQKQKQKYSSTSQEVDENPTKNRVTYCNQQSQKLKYRYNNWEEDQAVSMWKSNNRNSVMQQKDSYKNSDPVQQCQQQQNNKENAHIDLKLLEKLKRMSKNNERAPNNWIKHTFNIKYSYGADIPTKI